LDGGRRTEPAEPEKDRAENDEEDVARLMPRHARCPTLHRPRALAEHKRICECAGAAVPKCELSTQHPQGVSVKKEDSRRHMHGAPAGEVERTELEEPAGGVPRPARDGVVHDRRPAAGDELNGSGMRDVVRLT
jgi:hypothetical protein